MKKKLLLLILFLGFIALPLDVLAETKKYKTLDFKETLKDDSIELKFDSYKPNSDAITIYMFRGRGCGYCHSFLEFLNSITEEYGKYFKMQSYEVWYDKDNSKLMNEVSNYLGEQAGGVPYIIIGDKVFGGYSSTYDDSIKQAILDLYNTKSSKRYDVFKEMKKHPNKNNGSTISDNVVLILPLVYVIVATIIVITYVNLKFKEIQVRVDELNTQIAEKTKVKENKKSVSKVETKEKKKTKK